MTETPEIKIPLSERPLGYVIAVLGGLLASPLGLLTSPGVLYLLNKNMKGKEGKQPNRFAVWFLIGIIGAPVSLAIGNPAALQDTNNKTTKVSPPPSKTVAAAKAKAAAKKAESEKIDQANQKALDDLQKQSDVRMATLPMEKWTQNERDLAGIACNGAKANYERGGELGEPRGKENPFYNIMNSTKCVKWFGGYNGHPAGWTPEKDQADEEDAIRRYTVACKKAGVC